MERNLIASRIFLSLFVYFLLACNSLQHSDMILLNGEIITVDKDFTIAEAVAIREGKIMAVGSNAYIRTLVDSQTKVIDLHGSTVIPGLIDAHLHPESASLSELREKIPDLHTVTELLNWIQDEAAIKEDGEWIIHPKMFFTRLKELRQPSLEELDKVAQHNPVFLNGSFGGMINTVAMHVSGIYEKTVLPGIIHDEQTGFLTGFIRASAFNLLKLSPEKALSYDEKQAALETMLNRYNRLGITSVCSGEGDFGNYLMYRDMHDKNRLTVRIYQNILLSPGSDKNLKTLVDTLYSCRYAACMVL